MVRLAKQMDSKEITHIPSIPSSQVTGVPKPQRYQSGLKYYIHDSIEALRLELTGDLRDGDIEELNGCWRTAKTTLGPRKLLLDLRRLLAADDGGRRWLLTMSTQENASFLPEHPIHLQPAGQGTLRAAAGQTGKRYLLDKLFGFCRARVAVVKSSTPAP